MADGPDKTDELYPIAVLIDELKHDDVTLRLNAIHRLSTIALALGADRTRDELIPFLDESVEDEDEVLTALSEELGNFVEYVGGPEFGHVLLSPLENLAAIEEPLVREKAVESLNKICEELSSQQVEEYFIPLTIRLSKADWFTSKISATGLYNVPYKKASPPMQEQLRQQFGLLVHDETPMVRRQSANNLSKFVKEMPATIVVEEMIPLFQHLAGDDQDSVRLLTVEILIAIAEVVPKEQQSSHGVLLTALRSLIEDKSWRVRYMVADRFEKIAKAVDDEVVTRDLVPAFVKLLKDSEAEVRTAIAGQIPGFCKLVDHTTLLNDIMTTVEDLVSDTSQHVRAALGTQISGLAPILGKQETIDHLLPMFLQMLKDEFPRSFLNLVSATSILTHFFLQTLTSKSPPKKDIFKPRKMLTSTYNRNQVLGFMTLILTLMSLSEARNHHHKEKHKHNNHNHHSSKPKPPSSSISQPPTPPPGPPDSPAPSLPPSPSDDPADDNNGIYNVRKYGAVGDGETDDTEAFKTAWDSSCNNENNTDSVLLVPYGYTFMIQSTIFTGPCRSYQFFQVDGTIVTPDGPESWPSNISKRQWLVFYRVNGMALKGEGVIDGRGQKWWDLPCKPHRSVNKSAIVTGPCDSPIALRFFMSSNLRVEGLQIKNSPQFHFRFDGCQGVHVESLHITAPPLSPNTDGIHIENSNSVTIYNSIISNGDDCVSIGSGSYDVDIRNLTCGPGGHGISIGSLGNHNSRACVSNITVRDSVIKYSDNGVRIKTWQGGSGSVSGVTFNNIHVDSVRNPIIIDQYYCMTKDCANKTSAVFVSDIAYQGIKGTYDIRSPPMHFGCSDAVPCTNLTLSDIELLPAKGEIVLDPFCWNAYGIAEELSIPPVWCLMSDPPKGLQGSLVDKCGSS